MQYVMPRQRHYKNPTTAGICLFATTTVLDFVPVFRNPELADLAVREIRSVAKKRGATLHSFVVMPEHIHLLVALAPRDTASQFVGRPKKRIAEVLLPLLSTSEAAKFCMQRGLNRREFWKVSYRGFSVERGPVFFQKMNYIHENPVRRELVERSEDYRWASAALFERGLWSEERGLEFTLADLPGRLPICG